MVAQLYIDGAWIDAALGGVLETRNPATGEVITEYAAGSTEDVDRAVSGARRAFDEGPWGPDSSPRERATILFRAAEIMRRDREKLAELETRDNGKLYSDALEDIDESAFMFEYYAGWATKVMGTIPPVGPDAMSLIIKEPVGVAALITPWNYPVLMASQKIAPALAAGCTAILKPASPTPLSSLELARILDEAGLPAGVFNVLNGPGSSIGDALVTHPGVDKISFTGSDEVGKRITRLAADTMKRVTMELGGKSPNLVFSDASLDEAYEGSAIGIFYNQGEVCSAGSRVLVERSIYDDALEAMTEYAANLKLGDGMDPDTTMGPLVSSSHRDRVNKYIEIGKESGARLVFEGEVPTATNLVGGYFVPPTIFADVDNQMTIAQEEIFGPVMAVIPFEDVDDAVRIANDSVYGLAASVWTNDITKALKVSKALRAGIVWINDTQPAPSEAMWGGYKQSCVGRELGPWGLESFLETKHIYVNLES
jgi:acyl-CoA reductase-like NAD-dependent aldehyde dehydrogenase